MPEREQKYWRSRFISRKTTQKTIRREILRKLKIDLNDDSSLTNFRRWLADQDELADEAAIMAEEERHLTEQLGDSVPLDKIREVVLRRSYARSIARNNFQLGLRTMSVDQKERALQLQFQIKHFDAAESCLKHLPEVKRIANNPKLSQREKINAIRRMLFGELPEDVRKEKQNEEGRN